MQNQNAVASTKHLKLEGQARIDLNLMRAQMETHSKLLEKHILQTAPGAMQDELTATNEQLRGVITYLKDLL